MTGMIWSREVESWVFETEARITAVLRAVTQAVSNQLRTTVNDGGKLPIKTGNLRRSLLASTTGPIPIKEGGGDYADGQGLIASAILGLDGDTQIWFGFQAEYARRMEYGFVGKDSLDRDYNQSGFGFVAAVVQRWPLTVKEEAEKIRNRVMARQAGK